MLFNSFAFAVFLPIVFLLYWFVFNKNLRWQNAFVVVASYVFYGWWDWRFLLLIAFTSFCSWGSGIAMMKAPSAKKKAIAAANIVLNLLILGVFKYYDFFVNEFARLFHFSTDGLLLKVILPVGISFYTFQALSYSIDVYRGKIEPTRDIIAFFAYVSFFPQLVAGPIERATRLLPQFEQERHFDEVKAVDGLRQMLWGFFKKVVVADSCAGFVDTYWGQYADLPGIMLVALGVLFSFQIYCDFSGYSDIAIGCARLFGINLMRNFQFPYFSRSIPEFWRRWHISLTSWFRDYVYFPLGGSRCSTWKMIRNILIVWAISGLWHGADWTFVCWGLFHGLLLIVYKVGGFKGKYDHDVAEGRLLPNWKELCQIVFTFILAVAGWIVFRAESMSQVAGFYGAMFTHPFLVVSAIPTKHLLHLALCILLLLSVEWSRRDRQHALESLEQIKPFATRMARWSAYAVLVSLILLHAGKGQTFIYFQF